ncbi:esterase-like activity of phytase family protein [Azospirillum sp. ST 5-10]|uniref:esterase-like activity of phytase family protein n=1 Tax=unclassified Azospirillum TaxID=2630922 RepID=UPI003F4A29DD
MLALFLVAGCSAVAGGAADGTAAGNSRAMPLDPGDPQRAAVGRLLFRGAVEVNAAGVGGLSGLALLGGDRFAAVSDRGKVVFGRLRHDAAGRLTGVAGLEVRRLPRPGGPADAEDIQHLDDGGWLVSFERAHRILRYPPGIDRAGAKPVRLPAPPGLEEAPRNGGIEAMARLPDGRLLVLEEGADDGTTARRAWIAAPPIRARTDWTALTYRAAPGFRTTGAAVTPAGDLLVLERSVSWLGGWQSRVVRVPAGAWDRGRVLDGEELAHLSLPLLVDNFEGIAAAPGAAGETEVYLVSDDNFSPLQRTLIVQFALPAEAM